ncbi:MAG: hypothetical protein Q4A17_02925 [Thermoguttaceae bacterium]|nr:hypothetical protein [Thermoguttaceae bacterium]MDO4856880.1 hypothetical protein [Thermoguttaceae bacterium]
MTPFSLILAVAEDIPLDEKAGHIVSLFFGLMALIFLICIASFVIKHFRAAAHSEADPAALIHSMLANLQKSYDRGEISPEEYRTVKAELTAQLRDLMKN